jgi:riboflavin kinase/FMN adenylyltransferase
VQSTDPDGAPAAPGPAREPERRWDDLSEVPPDFGRTVVTIGNFDGVHRGHHAVLALVTERARALGLRSVAITFDPHPLAVLYPDRAPEPLTTTRHKQELLGEAGIDAVLVMAFTQDLLRMSPREFVEVVIVDGLRAREVVVGGDTRFGYRNAGDVGTLRELGAEFGFEVRVVPDLGDGEVRRWSSTHIRQLVAEGEVADAAELLGRPHRVTGEVVVGDRRGRELGYPTANLAPDAVGAVPADGVYAGWLVTVPAPGQDAAQRWPAAISIGTNPTFDGAERRVEAYVLDRTDLDLYGLTVAVEFVSRLRPTLRFDGIDPLIAQMAQDVARCREVLGVRTPA